MHTLSSTHCHTYTSLSGIRVCLCQLSCSCAIGDEPLILEQWSCDGRPSTEILGAHEEVRAYRQYSVPVADSFSKISNQPKIWTWRDTDLKDQSGGPSSTHRQDGISVSQALLVNGSSIRHANLFKSRKSVNGHDLRPAKEIPLASHKHNSMCLACSQMYGRQQAQGLPLGTCHAQK